MKKILFTTLIVASFGAPTSFANEVFADYSVSSALPGVSSEAAENLRECLYSDAQVASSKAIRACSKAYKAAIPLYDIRSDILTRRGLLQLSAGRFDKASRDFKSAAKLNKQNEFAYLGEGYAALMKADYATATQSFEDCASHHKTAPLAVYGLAIAQEKTGDVSGAIETYKRAAQMRPDWLAPREELARIKASI